MYFWNQEGEDQIAFIFPDSNAESLLRFHLHWVVQSVKFNYVALILSRRRPLTFSHNHCPVCPAPVSSHYWVQCQVLSVLSGFNFIKEKHSPEASVLWCTPHFKIQIQIKYKYKYKYKCSKLWKHSAAPPWCRPEWPGGITTRCNCWNDWHHNLHYHTTLLNAVLYHAAPSTLCTIMCGCFFVGLTSSILLVQAQYPN